MSRLRPLVVASLMVLLAAPAVAAAHPVRGFAGTFPHAARLCARVDAGQAPKRLASSADQVKVACATLHTSFSTAQTTLTGAVRPLVQQAKDALATAHTTCQQDRAGGDQAGCKTARQQARTTLKGLRAQAKSALHEYHATVQAARKAFWATVAGLRGGSAQTPDTTVGADPAVALPATA